MHSVHRNDWQPLSVTESGPKFYHLFFADDVLLFSKARPSQARLVANVLKDFCAISGLKVSIENSRALASRGVTNARKDKIHNITQINFTNNLGKYLGFKIFNGRPTREDFAEVIGRVDTKLASWKGKLLNKPGRVTLAKSVLMSTPAYGMQLMWYPQHICDHLDKMVRSFIWKGTIGRGLHLVNWRVVTKPTRCGGLGVRIARHQNIALLGKLVWEVV